MINRQSYLDTINAGRRRRPSTSLEQLSQSLDDLESRIRRPYGDHPESARAQLRQGDQGDLYPRLDRPLNAEQERHDRAHNSDSRTFFNSVATEINELREDMRHQMSTGLRREFSALRSDIDRALSSTAPAPQAADINLEFERLASMIQGLDTRGYDRQVDLLRQEMEEVKGVLGKLAREDSLRAYDSRWNQMEQRWADIADRAAQAQHSHTRIDPALDELKVRLEHLGATVGSLPTTSSIRAIEENLTTLAAAVDHLAHGSRADPRMLDGIEERLDEISRAVAASLASSRTVVDPEPFERIEARIASLSKLIGDSKDADAVEALADQVAAVSRRIEDLAQRPDVPAPLIDRFAGQITAIINRIDASPTERDMSAAFATIETRFAELSRILEERHQHASSQDDARFRHLEHRLNDVAAIMTSAATNDDGSSAELLQVLDERLSRFAAQFHRDQPAGEQKALLQEMLARFTELTDHIQRQQPATRDESKLIEAMEARFADLASRLDSQATARPDDKSLRDLEYRIASLSERIDQTAQAQNIDPNLIRSLESQVSALASQLNAKPSPAAVQPDLGPRLAKIEDAITSSRHDVVEAARVAAEEAVRRFAGSPAEREVVTALVDDLRSLETLARKSDDRNTKTFEAIHDTLLKIVDRIGVVEAGHNPRQPLHDVPQQRVSFNVAAAPAIDPEIEALGTIPVEADANSLQSESPDPQQLQKRSAAAAAAEAAADAVRKDLQASGTDGTGARKSRLGGLSRVLPGRKAKAERAEAAPPVVASPQRKEPELAADQPLDPAAANRPLEPGSGAPDLNAIMKRVRDERGHSSRGSDADAAKSDFIAAARRAAQAAAAEAETMRRSPTAKDKSGKLSIGTLLRSRRKPLLMGIAAVLMALAALQMGKSVTTTDDEVAQLAAPSPIVAEAQQQPQEAPIVANVDAPSADMPVPPAAEAEPIVHAAMTAVPSAPETVEVDWLDATGAQSPATADAANAQDAPTLELPAALADVKAAPDEVATMSEALPQTDDAALAAIPVEAGPIALREAAATGDPKAFFEIGNRYAEGRGVAEDMVQAAIWYEKAADAGLAPAQYRIGNIFEKGVGVSRDVAKAKTWYQLAAAQGNASAMHNLAVLYAMGADGTTDNESAARWFLEAAEYGVKDSQFNLGILAAKGIGMKQDLPESYKWFALVARSGDKDAAAKRDEVANNLSPKQLEKARAAAELWRVKDVDPEANAVDLPDSWSEGADTTASVDLNQAMRDIQTILNDNGYDAGPADGLLGRRTQTAIAAFQKDNDMAATGEVDESLVRALLATR